MQKKKKRDLRPNPNETVERGRAFWQLPSCFTASATAGRQWHSLHMCCLVNRPKCFQVKETSVYSSFLRVCWEGTMCPPPRPTASGQLSLGTATHSHQVHSCPPHLQLLLTRLLQLLPSKFQICPRVSLPSNTRGAKQAFQCLFSHSKSMQSEQKK